MERGAVLCTHHNRIIGEQIARIPELPPHGRVPQHGIHALRIARDGRRLEVLHELAHAHQLTREAELLLCRLEGRDRRGGVVRAVQVPCQEAREVLEGSEGLVAAD
jgi:hypothetical protein